MRYFSLMTTSWRYQILIELHSINASINYVNVLSDYQCQNLVTCTAVLTHGIGLKCSPN